MNVSKKLNNPLVATGYFFTGLGWLMRPELRPFVLMPLLINFLLYALALVLGYHYINALIAQFIPDWLNWLSWVLWPLFFICFFIAGFFTFTVMANLLAAPFYGKLAAKTAALLNGNDAVTMAEQPISKVMAAEFKRVLYLATRAVPLLVLFVIPGLNVAAPFLWALFGAWGMALEYLAFPLENAGVLFPEQKQLAKDMRLGSLSFGGVTMLGLTLPVLNIIVAPAAVIAATIYVHAVQENQSAN
ncbi:MAG: sulfate transporter CysZ [Methylovulum sp.]|uniref:sulfate transporter CysZ n=1 Tax=Methylovulum sp. TaxID=1916980 RepID=UPI00260BA19D|nr:sulfate transporter CysZ [Methylovulum sp.]MDD2723457.1 sulfate transporter CysZ [Methylovulum sp.]MDD5123925.1 sulfate transporter CysZ [Methylovulum sp.]